MNKHKKIISKLLIASLLIGGTFTINCSSVNALELSDISNHWAKNSIQRLVDAGGIKGYPDGTFKTERSISNAEFISIVVGSVLKEQVAKVEGQHWAQPAIDVAISKGILKDGEIVKGNYDKPMSREDMAVVLTRISEDVLKEAKVDGSNANKYIRDYSSLDSSKRDYVVQAFMKGLLNGKENNNFKPKDNLTRAEASTVIIRLLDVTTRVIPKEFSTEVKSPQSYSTLDGLKKVDYPEEWDYSILSSFENAYEISAADAKAKYDMQVLDTNGGWGFKYRVLIKGEMVISTGCVKGNQYQEFGSVTMSKGGYQFDIVDKKPDFDAFVFHTQHNTIIVKGDPFK